MQYKNKVHRALRLLIEDVGKAEAIRQCVGNNISVSTAEKLVRGKYKLTPGGVTWSRLMPILQPYVGEKK